jgi:hypothetical protein
MSLSSSTGTGHLRQLLLLLAEETMQRSAWDRDRFSCERTGRRAARRRESLYAFLRHRFQRPSASNSFDPIRSCFEKTPDPFSPTLKVSLSQGYWMASSASETEFPDLLLPTPFQGRDDSSRACKTLDEILHSLGQDDIARVVTVGNYAEPLNVIHFRTAGASSLI